MAAFESKIFVVSKFYKKFLTGWFSGPKFGYDYRKLFWIADMPFRGNALSELRWSISWDEYSAIRTMSVAATKNVACIVHPGAGLEVIELAMPYGPIRRGQCAVTGYAVDIEPEGKLACVAAGAEGLKIVNISNQQAPVLIGTCNTPGDARGVALAGDWAYVADGAAGLQVIDVSNPSAPVLKYTYNTPGTALDVALSDGYIYVADGNQGLCILRWTGASEPTPVPTAEPTPTALPTSTPSPTPQEWLPGDINGDGAIGPEDMDLATGALHGTTALTSDQAARADANQDGVFDIADLIWIQDQFSR